jgi:hypothetical protein
MRKAKQKDYQCPDWRLVSGRSKYCVEELNHMTATLDEKQFLIKLQAEWI